MLKHQFTALFEKVYLVIKTHHALIHSVNKSITTQCLIFQQAVDKLSRSCAARVIKIRHSTNYYATFLFNPSGKWSLPQSTRTQSCSEIWEHLREEPGISFPRDLNTWLFVRTLMEDCSPQEHTFFFLQGVRTRGRYR